MLAEYQNIPPIFATVISPRYRLATLYELDTVYGLEDVYDMLEVINVDAFNERVLNAKSN